MTTSFAGVSLPAASKIDGPHIVTIRDRVLLSGNHKVQASSVTVINPKFRCLGTWAEYEAVLALVGTSGTLITEQEPSGYGTCYISALEVQESDNPSYFYFTVEFKRDTTS